MGSNEDLYALLSDDVVSRFWRKVNKDGPIQGHVPDIGNCWEWVACRRRNGYGDFSINGRGFLAHRIAWLIGNKSIACGMLVCHKCDNKRCVRLSHLFVGTHSENMADCKSKGRNRWVSHTGDDHWSRIHPELRAFGDRNGAYTKPECVLKGEKHGMAKLTEEDVLLIRSLLDSGRSMCSLAREYSVAYNTIYGIKHRITWKHL